jgi:hypothetical protein
MRADLILLPFMLIFEWAELFIAVILENLGYRQLNSLWRLKGLVEWTFGRKAEWGEMTRVASWQAEATGEGESAK